MIWDFYFNSQQEIDRTIAANLILFMGFLFSAASGLFAWSLESRRDFLEREVERKTKDLLEKNLENKKADIVSAAIYQSCHILFSHKQVSRVLESVMDSMEKVLHADEGSVMLLNEENKLTIAASRGIPEGVAKEVQLKIGERVAGRAALLRREFLIVDGLEKYPEFKGIEPNSRIRSSIVCPLICQDRLLGVLNLNRTLTQENFSVEDLIHASIFSAQVAQALQNAKLYQAYEKKILELSQMNQKVRELQSLLP